MRARTDPAAPQWPETWLAPAAAAAMFLTPFAFFWRAALGQVLFAPSDALLYFFPIRVLTARLVASGQLPLWNPYIFSGVPYLAEIQTAVLYPFNLLFFVLSPLWAMNLQMITTYSVAALGTFAYTRAAGCSVLGAAIGGLGYAFGGFMVGHLPHTGLVQGAAWLPGLLWCLERLRRGGGYQYIAAGAVVVACAVFAGHPQMAFALLVVGTAFGVYFAIAGGAPIRGWRYVWRVGATLAAGVLLSAIQIAPTAELMTRTARSSLGFDEFTLFSMPVAQLPGFVAPFLFGGVEGHPYWGVAVVGNELLGYIGIVPIFLIVAALPAARRDRFAWFWIGMAAFALAMILGPRTPLAAIMFHVPVYNLFRVTSRHLLHFDLALAVLAAWSATCVQRAPRRWAIAAPVIAAGLVLALLIAAAVAGTRIWGTFAAINRAGGFADPQLADAFRVVSPAIALPAVAALLGGTVVMLFARRPSLSSGIALLAVHVVDLAIFTAIFPQGWPPPDAADRVPDFIRYVSRVEANAGDYRLALVHAGRHEPARYDFALSGVPIINGYEPLILSRYQRLTGMTYYGVIADPLIATRPGVLDLLNTRYLALVYPGRSVFADGGAPPFAAQPIELELQPGEHAEFALPSDCPASAIAFVSAVRGGGVRSGDPVARLRVLGQDGTAIDEVTMTMGRDTDRWETDGHAAPPPGLAMYERDAVAGQQGALYLRRVTWDRSAPVRSVTIDPLAPTGALRLSRITLVDEAHGAACPLTRLHARWSADHWERVYGNGTVDLLRNRQALPRAWLVPRTVAVGEEDTIAAIQLGRLPDGTPFDPRAIALVDGAAADDGGAIDSAASARITAYGLNTIELETRSTTGAFLVLSEIFYPGWTADVDGSNAPIVRTNYILRGLTVPAGTHRVRLRYRPLSVQIGAAVSAVVAIALAALTVRAVMQRRREGRM